MRVLFSIKFIIDNENESDNEVLDDDMIDLNISDDDDDDMELNAMAADNDDILSNEEDEEEEQENDWGSKRKVYYEPGETNTGKLDEEEAREEEEEAIRLQKKQFSELTADDYGEIFEAVEEEEEQSKSSKNKNKDIQPIIEHIERDLSKLNSTQIKEILSKEVPDLLLYYEKLESLLPTYQNDFQKVYEKTINSNVVLNEGKQYIKFKQSLVLNYLYNIIFYTLLKVEGKDPRIHPISNYLKYINDLINKTEKIDNNIKDKINEFMNNNDVTILNNSNKQMKTNHEMESIPTSIKFSQNNIKNNIKIEEENKKQKAKNNQKISNNNNDNSDSDEEYQYIDKIRESRKRKIEESITILGDKVKEGNNTAPRRITQEIMKNRGLSTHKNKMHRNPRVTKRMQYEKAIKRRRSAVPDVRVGESGRYGGESSGIRSDIARSRKLA